VGGVHWVRVGEIRGGGLVWAWHWLMIRVIRGEGLVWAWHWLMIRAIRAIRGEGLVMIRAIRGLSWAFVAQAY